MKNESFVIERTYNAPILKVWKAITDRNNIKQWYFDIAEFKPEKDFEFRFSGGTENRKYMHLCKVTEIIIGRKLTYRWRYDGYEGDSVVTYELFEEAEKTRLKLIYIGLESFPTDNPDFAKERFAEGWTYIIGTSLERFSEKPVPI
ncbi:MAG: SRPBCC domain-containing protein [Bacteroidota bacterium]